MSTSANPQNRTVKVGLFVLIGLFIFIAGILTIGGMRKSFVSKISATSVFDDVNGLQSGNNIWFSGVKVGTVEKISFKGNSQVEVLMNIEEKSRQYIRKDALVRISSDGLIGNKIIVISGGTPKASPIEDGDVLSVQKEDSQQDIMNTLQANNKNILAITDDFKEISHKLRTGEGSVGKLLADDELYQNVETTLVALQRAVKQAETMTSSLNTYATKLNQKGGLANDMVTDTLIMRKVRQTVAELNETAVTARALVSGLKKTSEEVTNNIANNRKSPVGVLLHDEATAANLKNTIQNLESSTDKLDENMKALQSNFLFRRYFRKQEKAKKDTTSVE